MEMKTVWIDTDERYPDYSVQFTECYTGRKVQMTKKQISLVRRYKIILSQYETMCKQLYDSQLNSKLTSEIYVDSGTTNNQQNGNIESPFSNLCEAIDITTNGSIVEIK